jgi:hypothetical protein
MNYFISFVLCLVLWTFPTMLHAVDSNTVSSSVTGTTTVDRTPSTAVSPNIIINNQDVCVSGISGGVQSGWFGISFGRTIEDLNCERLKLARSLYGMGMKVASVSLLCQDTRVFQSMMMAGTPCPIDGKIGEAAKQIWDKEPYRRPDYHEWRNKKENHDKVVELDTFRSEDDTNLYNEGWNPYE